MTVTRSWQRRVAIVAAVLIQAPTGAAEAGPCWLPPVDAPITDPYREPACRWCPGNRGVEYGTSPGADVRAVATGRVTFVGTVAGTRYVVVRHANGWRVTYGRLTGAAVTTGSLVVRGAVVGVAAERFHLGLRDGATYLDPTPYFGRLVRRPRLIPADGSAPNRSGPPRLVCGR